MRIRTGYSFRTAYGFVEEAFARISTEYAPITDRASVYGFRRWKDLCDKHGKKPIYGVELAVTDSPNAKTLNRHYVTLIATTEIAPINRAVELAFSRFRYEPLLTYSDLNKIDHSVAVILGRTIDQDKLDEDREWWLADSPSTPKRMRMIALEKGWKLIASSDNYYPAPEDKYAFQLALGRDANTQSWPQHILGPDEELIYHSPDSLANRDWLASRCTADMPHGTLVVPDRSVSVEEWCKEGARELGIFPLKAEYQARLDRELEVIQRLGFEDYFIIIADLLRHCREEGVFIGPGRGSSAGSLVCYLMGITTVDPIEHDLLFERFLDPNRTDLPDIDVDFSDQQRHKAFTYLSDTYGRDHVARLGTVSFLREKAVAKEIGAGLGIPQFRFEGAIQSIDGENYHSLAEVLEKTSVGRELMREFPDLAVIKRVEGHPRHSSTHAAGVVVTDRPVCDYVAVDARNNTAMVDKHDAEALDMLKIDALGLKQLSIFEDCLELIRKPHSWLIGQPLNDPEAFKILNDKKFSGVFQYNGSALQQVSGSFTVETFEDMVATTALARPGPLGSGGTETWLKVRRGEEPVRTPHEAFDPIVGSTFGIILYQEQVMAAGREIGDMDWGRVTKLRKAVQYFGGAKGMEEFRAEFLAGSDAKGIPNDKANHFWDDLLKFGQYCFNKSHAVVYSVISYYCCFLKAHYPNEYAAAMLNHEAKPERQREMLRELEAEGVKYKPVDPETSGLKWKVSEKGLVGPITNVKGMGAKTAAEYVRARDAGSAPPKRALTLLANPATQLDSLTPIRDAISKNHPDLKQINIFSEPTEVSEIGEEARKGVMVFVRTIKATPRADEKWGGTKMTMICEDDSGEIKVFLNNRKYAQFGRDIMDAGRVGKTLFAVKGSTPDGGGIIFADQVRFLGLIE